MYWTDWGEPAKIERASMDGMLRQVIIDTDLTWPNGLTIDYEEQRIYWADAFLDKIEYSFVNGSVRVLLESVENGIIHPFAITLENELVFWTERDIVAIYATHKTEGANHTFELTFDDLLLSPYGIEAVTPDRQAVGECSYIFDCHYQAATVVVYLMYLLSNTVSNPCDGNNCSDLCLLSSDSSVDGFVCACPDGAELLADGITCNGESFHSSF